MRTPYIGICDFPSRERAEAMLDFFAKTGGRRAGRRLMIGIMMSRKTLCGLETRWAKAWPTKDEVAGIFPDHPAALNTIHYADYDGIDAEENLLRAASHGGPHLHALQLDMIWPDPAAVLAFRARRPEVGIVLQVGANALEQVGEFPRGVIPRLRAYGQAVDWVLLDKSMGRGLGMDAKALLPYARIIRDELPHLDLAAAGGLGPDSLDLVGPLFKEIPTLSIDAQGRLRTSGDAMDPIEWDRAERYLEQAIALIDRSVA